MCSGLFSCMDQKHVVFRENINALGKLLAQKPYDRDSVSKALSLADALSRVVPGRRATGHAELHDVTSSLYETTCELFEEPDSSQRWQHVHREYLRTHAAFCRELEKLRRSCGASLDPGDRPASVS